MCASNASGKDSGADAMDKYANFPTRKDGSYAEHYQAVDWVIKGVAISFAVSLLLSAVAYPL